MQETPAYELTSHAATVICERGIKREWIDRVLSLPGKTEPDKKDAEIRHALAPIREHGDRILRVIYNDAVSPRLIVSAYFDRSQRGKL
jgi:hypothetical protein